MIRLLRSYQTKDVKYIRREIYSTSAQNYTFHWSSAVNLSLLRYIPVSELVFCMHLPAQANVPDLDPVDPELMASWIRIHIFFNGQVGFRSDRIQYLGLQFRGSSSRINLYRSRTKLKGTFLGEIVLQSV